jgi:hypothetical protein
MSIPEQSDAARPQPQLAARLETRVKRNGKKWHREVIFLLSSVSLYQLQAQGMLELKGGYWVIESRIHHCLDITLREDQSRVRTPKAARALGTIRRVIVSLANAAVNRARRQNPKTKSYRHLPKTFPIGSRRSRAAPRIDSRQIPQCPRLTKLKGRARRLFVSSASFTGFP